jgi:hypothetical protein
MNPDPASEDVNRSVTGQAFRQRDDSVVLRVSTGHHQEDDQGHQ